VESPLARYADWLGGEIRRNDAFAMVQAGQALSRFHARGCAGSLDIRAGMSITTRDHLVKPARQRELAALLDAEVIEIVADHLVAWLDHEDFAASTVTLVRRVLARATPQVR
jgi:hypothetical protein